MTSILYIICMILAIYMIYLSIYMLYLSFKSSLLQNYNEDNKNVFYRFLLKIFNID
jgi:hypothetical protein